MVYIQFNRIYTITSGFHRLIPQYFFFYLYVDIKSVVNEVKKYTADISDQEIYSRILVRNKSCRVIQNYIQMNIAEDFNNRREWNLHGDDS